MLLALGTFSCPFSVVWHTCSLVLGVVGKGSTSSSGKKIFHALDYSMHLLGEIAVLLGVYNLRILVVGDCLTDVSTILIFVLQKSHHFG